MRLGNYSRDVEKRVRNANKRAGMELRDNVKALLNVPGYQIRQKGETGSAGFVVRKGRKIAASSASRFGVRSGIDFKKNEINYDVVRSRPGEPPRRQRGLLYQSQTYEIRDTFRGVTTRVGPSVRVAKYARALELGYAPGGLEPRPSLAPAARAYAPTYQELMRRAVQGAKP
jgi:hypothetical protein